MADINHVISLGIGSPAAIPEFLTFGLQLGAVAVVPGAPECRRFEIFSESRRFEVMQEIRRFEIPAENRRLEVECDT